MGACRPLQSPADVPHQTEATAGNVEPQDLTRVASEVIKHLEAP